MIEDRHVIEQAIEAVVVLAAVAQFKVLRVFGAERHKAVDIGEAGCSPPATFMANSVKNMQNGGRHPFPAGFHPEVLPALALWTHDHLGNVLAVGYLVILADPDHTGSA